MFSQHLEYSQKIVDLWFIAGYNESTLFDIINYKERSSNIEDFNFEADILIQYPKSSDLLTKSHLPLVFSTNNSILYKNQGPKFSSTVTTNIEGNRYFIYSLKINQEINKKFYLPAVIGIISTLENIDFFKRVLIHIYEISHFSSFNDQFNYFDISKDANLLINKFINLKYLEIINTLIFLTKIIQPPPFSNLVLDFHSKKIELYFESYMDLPNKDSSIQLLLDCLELSIIIKLWVSLLSEKNVILIGNRGLLYPACSALLALLFPFKWMHIYIPVLPDAYELEILEAPVPYLIGIPKERKDFKQLSQQYPTHIICDLSTSQISKLNYIDIPEQEENKLRTKVKYLRYPKLDNIEDMIEDNENLILKDVREECSFPQNIQRIFFRIFRDNLKNIEDYMDSTKLFNQYDFLEDLHNLEDRQFWEEIINSQAFEEFIVGYRYMDSINTLKFSLIEKLNEDTEMDYINDYCFEMGFNLPLRIDYLFANYIDNCDDEKKKYINNLILDYSNYKREKNVNNIENKFDSPIKRDKKDFFNNSIKKSISNNEFDDEKTRSFFSLITSNEKKNRQEKRSLYYITSNIEKDKYDERFSESPLLKVLNFNEAGLSALKNDNTIFEEDEKKNGRISEESIVNNKHNSNYGNNKKAIINNNKSNILSFELYGDRGFINFYYNLFEGVSTEEMDGISLSDLLYQELSLIEKSNKNISKIKFLKYIDMNQVRRFNDSKILNKYHKNIRNENNNILNLPISVNFINNSKRKGQYYSIIAYLFQEYLLNFENDYENEYEDINESEKKLINRIEFVFNSYLQSCFEDKENFNRVIFYKYTQMLDVEELKLFKDSQILELITLILNYSYKEKIKGKKGTMKSYKEITSSPLLAKFKYTEKNLIKVVPKTKSSKIIKKKEIIFDKEKDTQRRMTKHDHLNELAQLTRLRADSLKSDLSIFNDKLITKNFATALQINSTYANKNFSTKNVCQLGEIKRKNDEQLYTKTNNRIVSRFNIINKLNLVRETSRHPNKVSEELAEKTIQFVKYLSLGIFKSKINKIKIKELISEHNNILKEYDVLACEISKVNISLLTSNDMRLSFLLNTLNSLIIYSLIKNNRDFPSSLYTWQKFLKSNYNDIGGYHLSLLELILIISNQESDNDFIKNIKNNPILISFIRKLFNINENDIKSKNDLNFLSINPYINLCISFPIYNSSSNMNIYYTDMIKKQINDQIFIFLKSNIKIDKNNEEICINSVDMLEEIHGIDINNKSFKEYIQKQLIIKEKNFQFAHYFLSNWALNFESFLLKIEK